MDQSRLNKPVVLGALLGIVAALMFFGYLMLQSQAPGVTQPEATPPQDEIVNEESNIVRITAKHDVTDDEHTIAGTVDVPTPCHTLDVTSRPLASNPKQIELLFSTSQEEGTSTMCAQVITPARFSITVMAPSDAVFSALLNGTPAVLNLIPLPEGESMETFDEYIKG